MAIQGCSYGLYAGRLVTDRTHSRYSIGLGNHNIEYVSQSWKMSDVYIHAIKCHVAYMM